MADTLLDLKRIQQSAAKAPTEPLAQTLKVFDKNGDQKLSASEALVNLRSSNAWTDVAMHERVRLIARAIEVNLPSYNVSGAPKGSIENGANFLVDVEKQIPGYGFAVLRAIHSGDFENLKLMAERKQLTRAFVDRMSDEALVTAASESFNGEIAQHKMSRPTKEKVPLTPQEAAYDKKWAALNINTVLRSCDEPRRERLLGLISRSNPELHKRLKEWDQFLHE